MKIGIKKGVLNMEHKEMISYSIVILDNVYSNIKFEEKQTVQINNVFAPIANQFFLKSILKSNVIEDVNKSHNLHKEFISDDIRVIWDFFPPKIQIKHITEEKDKRKFIDIAKNIISFTNLENNIGRVGINYEMFINDEKINLKDYLLKESIAKGFTELSATPVFTIDKDTVLNLTLASAINKVGKKGIYLQANFDNIISENNKFEKILEKDFIKIADEKVKLIFG